jgi:hypothetical protein
MTTVIESPKTYIATYTGLETGAPLWVDALGRVAVEYAISPLAGARIAESYIDGSTLREFPFSFSSAESTADELERIANIGFYEAFAQWLEDQSNSSELPTMGTGMTAEKIEATGWGYLFQEGESGTGIYQILCRLTYKQDP